MVSSKQKQSTAVYALVIVGVAFLFLFAKALLVPLAFALSLSLLLLPAVTRLERVGLPRTVSVLTASGVACIILLCGAALIYHQGLGVAQTLVSHEVNVKDRISTIHSPTGETLGRLTTMLEDLSADIVTRGAAQPNAQPVQIVSARSAQVRELKNLASSTLEPIGSISIVIIFALYMLMNWEELRHRLLLLAGMGNISLMTRALDDATQRISDYLLMQLEVNAGYGFMFGLSLFLLHVPNALLWGVLAGGLRIVPFVGTLIGMLLPLILSLAVSTSSVQPIGVFVAFLVLEFSTTNFIEPWLFSEQTGISSLALLASAIFWSMLWGWPGLVLSTPLTVCLIVLGRHVPQFSFLHSLMATNATLSPPAHMYERLLAMDQDEAWAIAERYLSNHSLSSLYDSVLLPVLNSAEEDRHRGALEPAQEQFLHHSLTELLARMTDYDEIAPDERSATSLLLERLNPAQPNELAVVCVPVSDSGDDLATQMLSQLLERNGVRTLSLKPKALTDEIASALGRETKTIVVLSALPPMAFAQTRALCQKLRKAMPENRIAVGFWRAEEDGLELQDNFKPVGAAAIFTSLQSSVNHIKMWQSAK